MRRRSQRNKNETAAQGFLQILLGAHCPVGLVACLPTITITAAHPTETMIHNINKANDGHNNNPQIIHNIKRPPADAAVLRTFRQSLNNRPATSINPQWRSRTASVIASICKTILPSHPSEPTGTAPLMHPVHTSLCPKQASMSPACTTHPCHRCRRLVLT